MSDRQRPHTEVRLGSAHLYVKRRGQKTGVRTSEGVVRFENQPGLRYDHTVELRIVEDESAPRIAVVRHEERARAGDEVTAGDAYEERAKVEAEAVTRVSFPVDENMTVRVGPPWLARFKPARADVNSTRARNAGRHDHVLEQIGETPRLYERARAAGQSPREAVARGLGISVSTADKRIAAAREQDLLPPATTGRPKRLGEPFGEPFGMETAGQARTVGDA